MANSNIQFRATAGANPVVEYELFDGLIPSGKISRVISPYASTAVLGNSIQINGVSIPAQMYRFDKILDAGGVPFADVNSANTYLTDLFSNYITGSRGAGGGGGGGDASAANQVIGNTYLQNIDTNLTNFVDFEKTTKDYICIVTGAAATAGEVLRKREFNVVNQATGTNTVTVQWYNVSLGSVMAVAPLDSEYVEYSENKVSRSANSSATTLSYRAIENDDINPIPEFSMGDFLIRTTNHNYRFEDGVYVVDSVTTTWFNLATSATLTTDPPNSYIEFYDGMDYNTTFSLKYIIATNTDAGLKWTEGDLLEMRFYDVLVNGGFIIQPFTLYRNITTNSATYFGIATIDELTFEPVETRVSNSLTFLEKLQLEEKSLCGSIVVANSPSSGDTTTYFNYSSQYVTSGSFDTSVAQSAVMRLIEFADGSVEMKFADGERFLYSKVFDNHLTFTY